MNGVKQRKRGEAHALSTETETEDPNPLRTNISPTTSYLSVEKIARVFPFHRDFLRERAEQLDHLREVIIIAGVRRFPRLCLAALVRIEEQIAREQLKDHARHGPQVRGCAVLCS